MWNCANPRPQSPPFPLFFCHSSNPPLPFFPLHLPCEGSDPQGMTTKERERKVRKHWRDSPIINILGTSVSKHRLCYQNPTYLDLFFAEYWFIPMVKRPTYKYRKLWRREHSPPWNRQSDFLLPDHTSISHPPNSRLIVPFSPPLPSLSPPSLPIVRGANPYLSSSFAPSI